MESRGEMAAAFQFYEMAKDYLFSNSEDSDQTGSALLAQAFCPNIWGNYDSMNLAIHIPGHCISGGHNT